MHLVARRAAEFGVVVDGPVQFDLAKAIGRKNAIVSKIHASIHAALEHNREHIRFIRGDATFIGDHEIDTGDEVLSFGKAIIATGARNTVPPIENIETVEYLTNRTALELEELPERLIVIGGGYVGIEFAQAYSRFGSRVTLIGRNRRLAPGEDHELADLLRERLVEEGLDVRTGEAVRAIRREGSDTVVTLEEGMEVRGDAVLVATGRVGNTDGLGLEAAGVETRPRGFVRVDEELRTSQPHIWAIGDVKGGFMFTHVATYDGPLAATNAIKDAGRKTDDRVVPRAIFSDPTLASVGLTEEAARAAGYEIEVGAVDAVGARVMARGDGRGRLKAVVDATNDQILGFHVLAAHGDDLLHEAVVAMYDRGTNERIRRSIHVHPTLSEMVKAAAKAAR